MTNVAGLNVGMFIMVTLVSMMVIDGMIGQLGGKTLGQSVWEVLQLAYDYAAAGMAEVADAIRRNTNKVVEAINRAARALKKTVKELTRKFKFFPVFESLTPDIFAFNVAALATHPHWFMLNYNGAGSPRTTTNRAWIATKYGYMMATAPSGYQLDEFPYACTAQGGRFGPALAKPVPALQNSIQGGYLGAFARWTLKGRPQPFVVVPVPL